MDCRCGTAGTSAAKGAQSRLLSALKFLARLKYFRSTPGPTFLYSRLNPMSDMLTSAMDRHGAALSLLSQRQKVLAGNIANADTPGFKARDFDFSAALADARVEAAKTGGTEQGEVKLQYRHADQPTLDGNTVDLDRERAAFADNALRYEATLRFINQHSKTMISAITGQ